jgi:ketosteroid isomerase-like protein
MSPTETVLQFMDRINQRDVDKLAELMTEDHVFTDSLENSVHGREKMREGWRGYYAFCPDYWVSHEDIFENGNLVAVFGSAGGTIAANGKLPPENKWQTPAAWRALVDKGLVKEWRVYADNKPVYDIIAKQKAGR